MDIYRLLDLIRSRPAVLIATALVMIFVFGMASALRPHHASSPMVLYTNSPAAKPTVFQRDTVPVVPLSPKPPARLPAPPSPPVQIPETNSILPPLAIHVDVPTDTNLPPLQLYAPAGRLIKCVLANSVDSANIDTPIIGLVTDDLWHDGRLVVPAGTEVHGKASVDRMRDRIVASGSWTVVWQTGQELVVNGSALDREENPNLTTWSDTDGTAGLKGQVFKSDSLAEAKLFVATFMSGVASGLQRNTTTLLGTQVANTVPDAALAGASQVMNTYAQQILDAIRREGVFVRVPAGKQMYLYVNHTIDHSQAKIGNMRVNLRPADTVLKTMQASKP